MSRKLTQVLAHHLVWTGYGWWLPNDPRGSGSHVVHTDILRDLGKVHDHPIWTRGGYKVFLDSPDDILRTIGYVERNPLEIGWEPQAREFVTEYDGWPFHQAPKRQASVGVSRTGGE